MRPFWVLVFVQWWASYPLPCQNIVLLIVGILTLVMSGIRLPSCGLMSGICHGPIINLHSLQPVGLAVYWCHLLWFKGHIRRYSCILWLAIEGRISTQDSLRDMGIIKVCAFVKVEVRMLATFFPSVNFQSVSEHWFKIGIGCPGTTWSSRIAKLALSLTIYFIWKERNQPLFQGKSRRLVHVYLEITAVIKLSLFCRVAPTLINLRTLQAWNLPDMILAWDIIANFVIILELRVL